MLSSFTIERIPRLTRPLLEQLIVRVPDTPMISLACLNCRNPLPAPVPFRGKILCLECAEFTRMGIRL